MTKQLKIITDTGADLHPHLLEGRDIEILSMEIEIDGCVRKPADELNLQEMYDAMRNKSIYKTAQVTLEDFLSCFKQYTDNGQPILYIALSSGLSGTVSAANLAAEQIKQDNPGAEISIIDSKCATIGYGRAVLLAYDLVQQGCETEAIIATVNELLSHTEHLFTVSTLEYLVRGGRLSAAAAAIAGTLNIKPILNINDSGELVAIEKIRGSKKLKQRMADLVFTMSGGLEDQTIYVVHGDSEELADEMINLINERTPIKKAVKMMIGCTIGAHAGPGTFGIVFSSKDS